MELGIFAKTFAGVDPFIVLTQAKAAGFTTVQYNMACSGLGLMPDEIPGAALAALRDAVAETGVPISALSATYNMIHPDPAQRGQGHRRLRVVAEAAAALGIPLLTLCTGTRDPDDQWRGHRDNDTPEAWRDLLQSMTAAIAIAEEFDLSLGIEPELANVIDGAAKARRLMDEMQSPRLRIVFDPANLFEIETLESQRRVVSEAIDILAPRIAIAHAKDRVADGTFAAAGTGVLDYRHFIGALKTAGFTGPLVTHGLAAAEAPGVARFLNSLLDSG